MKHGDFSMVMFNYWRVSKKHLKTITSVNSVVYSATETGAISPTCFGYTTVLGRRPLPGESLLDTLDTLASFSLPPHQSGLSQNEVTTPKFGWFLISLPIETSNIIKEPHSPISIILSSPSKFHGNTHTHTNIMWV